MKGTTEGTMEGMMMEGTMEGIIWGSDGRMTQGNAWCLML